MSAPRYRHIDPRVLMRAVADDLESFRELSRIFVAITPAMFERLQRALAAGAQDEIAQASHALKGNAALVGAAALTGRLQDIESAARGSGAAPAALEPDGLAALFQQALGEVRDSIEHFDGRAES